MPVRVEDLCHSCKHFDMGNYECKEGHFLDGESEKFTIECDDYEGGGEEALKYLSNPCSECQEFNCDGCNYKERICFFH